MIKDNDNYELKDAVTDLRKDIIDFNNQNQAVISKLELLEKEIIKSELNVEKIIDAGNDVDENNRVRNEDVMKKMQEAMNYLTKEKQNISEEVIESLGLKETSIAIQNALEKLNEISSMLKTSLENNNSGIEILKSQTSSLASSIRDIQKLTTSLGLNMDYTREVQEIIKFIKQKSKRGISIDELRFRFNEKIVKDVLEKGEDAGYWSFKF